MKPAHFQLDQAIRSNILALSPYRCARDDYNEGILLDANENSLGHALPKDDSTDSEFPFTSSRSESSLTATFFPFDSRSFVRLALPEPIPFPDPQRRQTALVQPPQSTFTRKLLPRSWVRRSDRFALPNHLHTGERPRTRMSSDVWNVQRVRTDQRCRSCQSTLRRRRGQVLTKSRRSECFLSPPIEARSDTPGSHVPRIVQINRTLSEAASSPNPIKLLFLCSPGNPTGTLIPLSSVRKVLENPDYKGLVVVDEAYVDFADEPDQESAVKLLIEEGWDNLVVMQTLSKGFGLAAIR